MEEKKQLNFDKPLLSVRRFPSKVAIVNNGKCETDKSLPVVPQLPRYKSELKSGLLRHPGTVPFVWEQCPGKPKDEKTKPRPPAIPKLPPGRVLRPNASAKPSANSNQDDEIRKCESPKGSKTEEEENPSSEDGDGAYEDARDTISRTESNFINCSVSGLSGLDEADMKTPTDPKTRDFMMGRFLPAAKAMASETPQHGSRKPTKRLDIGDEGSDDEYDDREILPFKVCGLLPRIGFKSSFCLLNPLPGMTMRSRSPMSPLRKIQQATSSSSGSCGEHERVLQSFQELLADQNGSNELLAGEKTLYVDAAHKVESMKMKEIESSIKDIKKLSIVEKGAKSSSSDETNGYTRKVASKPFGQYQDSIISPSLKVSREASSIAEKLENDSKFPAPPPLPKSPTDSWLGRTMSAKKPSIHSSLGTNISTRYDTSKTKSYDPKWETIVKTTEKHMRFAEERLTTISET